MLEVATPLPPGSSMATKPQPESFGLKTEAELTAMILSRSVLVPWANYRDQNHGTLQLHPTIAAKIKPINRTAQQYRIMAALKSIESTTYDSPEEEEKPKWETGLDFYFERLVYRICKRLARLNEPFEKTFAGKWPAKTTQKWDIRAARVMSVMDLGVFLIHEHRKSYSEPEPTALVAHIERLYPCANPMLSPDYSVWRCAVLESYSHEQLVTVANQLVSEVAANEDLINCIMGLEAVKSGPNRAVEGLEEGEQEVKIEKNVV